MRETPNQRICLAGSQHDRTVTLKTLGTRGVFAVYFPLTVGDRFNQINGKLEEVRLKLTSRRMSFNQLLTIGRVIAVHFLLMVDYRVKQIHCVLAKVGL